MSLHVFPRPEEIDPYAVMISIFGEKPWRLQIPVEALDADRAFVALRGPTDIDATTAPPSVILPRAQGVPYVLRAPAGKGFNGRRRALRWAGQWLGSGCPGKTLQRPRERWRAARMPGGGIGLYRADTDSIYLWLAPPSWSKPGEAFEEIWHAAADRALEGAGA